MNTASLTSLLTVLHISHNTAAASLPHLCCSTLALTDQLQLTIQTATLQVLGKLAACQITAHTQKKNTQQ